MSNKYITKGLALGIALSNISANSIINASAEQISVHGENKNIDNAAKEGSQVDTWLNNISEMPVSKCNTTIHVSGDNIYIISGVRADDEYTFYPVNTMEVYNTKTNEWNISKSSIPNEKFGMLTVEVNDKIYTVGGTDNIYGGQRTYEETLQVYDIKSDTWTIKSDRLTTNDVLEIFNIGNKIYCVTKYNSIEIYDIESNSWDIKTFSLTSPTSYIKSLVLDNKIYIIGNSEELNKYAIKEYDIERNSWRDIANGPNCRINATIEVVDNNIYIIGGKDKVTSEISNSVDVYNVKKGTWETKANIPTARWRAESFVYDDKIYILNGYFGSSSSTSTTKVEVYNTIEDSWEEKPSMARSFGRNAGSVVVGDKYYVLGEIDIDTHQYLDIHAYVLGESPEDKVEALVSKAEESMSLDDIKEARSMVNELPESILKDQLQERLNNLFPKLALEKQVVSANLDVYIKSENMLSMSLDTNSVSFEEYSGAEPMEKLNAVNLTINSSLPYNLNAYMPTEITGSNGNNKMDIDILNIRESNEGVYKKFENTDDKLILKENCQKGNDINHSIDLKLDGNDAHEADIYKTVIKFEAEQK